MKYGRLRLRGKANDRALTNIGWKGSRISDDEEMIWMRLW